MKASVKRKLVREIRESIINGDDEKLEMLAKQHPTNYPKIFKRYKATKELLESIKVE